jgi:hypothetical protein
MNGSNLTVGAGGHYGRERIGADHTLDSWAFAIDYSVPILRRVTWRGENFVGSNLVPFGGGVLQGVAFCSRSAQHHRRKSTVSVREAVGLNSSSKQPRTIKTFSIRASAMTILATSIS